MNLNDIPKAIPIKRIVQENPHVKTFVFEHTLNSQPGQFVNLWIPRVDEKPMSIAYDGSADGKNEFWLTIFAVGPFSQRMHHLKVGDLVGVRGPYGKPFTYKRGQHLVMMAGGYGAAPLYNLAVKAIKDGCTVDFVIGARSEDLLLYLDKVRELKGVKLHVTTDDGSVGEKGFNTLVLSRLIADVARGKSGKKIDTVYCCGPELMMKAISNICHDAKVDAQISIERYMKCGFGVCGQCSVDPNGQPVCVNGPCVSNEVARSITEFGKYHRDKIGKMHEF